MPKEKAKTETEPEGQTPPEDPEDLNALPPGFGFGEGDEEPENLEDLDEPLDEEEAEEPEAEPEELTPEQVRALQQELDNAKALIGRQGEELGRFRQQPAPQGGGAFGYPSAQQAQQPADPMTAYRQHLKAATDHFVQTGDTEQFAGALAQLNIGLVASAGQYFEGRLTDREAQSKAEVDFLAKNADLVDGTPRSIFEGELAKLRLAEPKSPVTELRQRAADETRRQLRDWGWRQQDEDARARREGDKLRGPAGRRSRTGSQPAGSAASLQAARDAYIQTHRQRQSRS